MANACWFKPKTFGYGAVPVTWEGWLAVAIHISAFVAALSVMLTNHAYRQSVVAWIAFLVFVTVSTTALVLVTRPRPKVSGAGAAAANTPE